MKLTIQQYEQFREKTAKNQYLSRRCSRQRWWFCCSGLGLCVSRRRCWREGICRLRGLSRCRCRCICRNRGFCPGRRYCRSICRCKSRKTGRYDWSWCIGNDWSYCKCGAGRDPGSRRRLVLLFNRHKGIPQSITGDGNTYQSQKNNLQPLLFLIGSSHKKRGAGKINPSPNSKILPTGIRGNV